MNTLPIQSRQRQKEDFYFQSFCNGFPEIRGFVPSVPSGNGAPDFILEKGSVKVSLDLTAYFIDSGESDKGSAIKLEEGKFGWIIKRAQTEFEAISPFKLNIAFIKNHHYSVRLLNEDGIQDIVSNIIALILNYVSHVYPLLKEEHPWFRWKELREYDLENVCSSICINILPSDWQSLWAEAGGGGIPSVVHSRLQAIIQRKEDKVQKYLQYGNEAWLLIHTEMSGGMASWIVIDETDEELRKWIFETSFDRIFFVHSSRNRVIEFQVKKQKNILPPTTELLDRQT